MKSVANMEDLTTAVNTVAPTITNSASGSIIAINDSAERPLQGLTVYGKSTQDGTPTPEAPVDIVSAGDGGSVALTITDGSDENVQTMNISTPNGLPGIPVSSGGNYTDTGGQQWACDTVELYADGTGKRVQRVANYVFDGNADEKWNIRTWDGVDNHTIYVINVAQAASTANTVNYCSAFARAVSGWADSNHWFIDNNCRAQFFMPKADGFETVADWRNYLSENNLQILYVLAEPIETPLTAEETAVFKTIHAYYPATNVYNDAGTEQSVTYTADTKIYVDNKFEELRNAVLSMGGNV